jgi:hypothetical protein
MMSHDQWLGQILSCARLIADREAQRGLWFREYPLVDINWPNEIYCELFDDNTFDLFFEMYSEQFTVAQTSAWNDFNELWRNTVTSCRTTLTHKR